MLYKHSLPNSQSNFGFSTTRTVTHRAPRMRRGRIISFDSAAWEAIAQLDGALGAVPVAVGDWINPATLVANAKVAVLLFDDNNPADGLIAGAYDALGGWDYFVRDQLDTGETLTIPADHQMRVKDAYTVTGTLTVNGALVVD